MTEIMAATDDDNDDCDDDTEAAPAVMGQETVKSSSRTYSQQNTTISHRTQFYFRSNNTQTENSWKMEIFKQNYPKILKSEIMELKIWLIGQIK